MKLPFVGYGIPWKRPKIGPQKKILRYVPTGTVVFNIFNKYGSLVIGRYPYRY